MPISGNPYMPMGFKGIHPRILKELADVIAKNLSIIIFILFFFFNGLGNIERFHLIGNCKCAIFEEGQKSRLW